MSVILDQDLVRLETQLSSTRFDALRLMIRHRRLLGLVTLLAAILAVAVSWLLPPTYVATVRLLPPQQTQSPAALFFAQSTASPLAAMAQKELSLKNATDLYIGLLNSRSIQDALVRQFQLEMVYHSRRPTELREELAARTRIQVTKEGLITVSVEDREATRSAALANAYADALRNVTRRLAISEAGQRREFYNDQVRQAKEDLEQAESALSAVQQRTGVLQVEAHTRALIESASALRSRISSGEVELQALRNIGTEENPDVRQARARLVGWRRELEQLESQQSADPAFSKARAPAQAQEYLRALREVQYQRAVLDILLRQLEAAKLDEARETTVIQVVDAATPPEFRSSPKRTAIVILSALVALLATICVLRLRHRFHHSPAWQMQFEELCEEWRQTKGEAR
jgi:tyrosine-protein kinase Etk/Wzc